MFLKFAPHITSFRVATTFSADVAAAGDSTERTFSKLKSFQNSYSITAQNRLEKYNDDNNARRKRYCRKFRNGRQICKS